MLSDTDSRRHGSFAECRRITRHHAKSFYFSSHTLPLPKREAAYAIYAFCRYVDDRVDLAPNSAAVAVAIEECRSLLHALLARPDAAAPAWGAAFHETVHRYQIPPHYFTDLLTGVAMDQGPVRLQSWSELERYCYHVASVVGLMMTHVFTAPHDELLSYARDLGTAMQLTNILRDVTEDWQRDRIYLPADELAQFDVRELQIAEGRMDENFRALFRFQTARARAHYLRSEAGIRQLPNDGSQWTVWMMREIYAGILEEMEKLGDRVLHERAHVSLPRKFALAWHAWRRAR